MYSHVEPDPLVLGPVLDSAALEGVWHLGHHVRERDYGPPSPFQLDQLTPVPDWSITHARLMSTVCPG